MSDSETSPIRDRIELLFEAWGRFACRHAVLLIVGMLALSAALISRVPELEIDNSTDSFLHEDDPTRLAYDAFRRQFGRDERIVVAIEAPDLFSPDFLARLATLHEELEREVPHVEDMISMINARNTRGEGDELVVEELLEHWPETPQQLAAGRRRHPGGLPGERDLRPLAHDAGHPSRSPAPRRPLRFFGRSGRRRG